MQGGSRGRVPNPGAGGAFASSVRAHRKPVLAPPESAVFSIFVDTRMAVFAARPSVWMLSARRTHTNSPRRTDLRSKTPRARRRLGRARIVVEVTLQGVDVAAAAEVLTRGGKGNVTHAECCTLLEVRVQNALKKCLEEFQGLKALKCMSSIEDFVGISLVSPITRAARTYKEAKNTSAWQLAVLESSRREYCLMMDLSFDAQVVP